MNWPQELLTRIEQLPRSVKYIVGVDEVGRGALSGPMTLGVCVVSRSNLVNLEQIEFLGDSKKLSTKKRLNILKSVSQDVDGLYGSIDLWETSTTASYIDKNGIKASYLQMVKKLANQLTPKESMYLFDYGISITENIIHFEHFKKGDAVVPVIALASIHAKESRDFYMKTTLHKKLPDYGFDSHVGYGTVKHRQAIAEFGVTRHHRKTWIK